MQEIVRSSRETWAVPLRLPPVDAEPVLGRVPLIPSIRGQAVVVLRHQWVRVIRKLNCLAYHYC